MAIICSQVLHLRNTKRIVKFITVLIAVLVRKTKHKLSGLRMWLNKKPSPQDWITGNTTSLEERAFKWFKLHRPSFEDRNEVSLSNFVGPVSGLKK